MYPIRMQNSFLNGAPQVYSVSDLTAYIRALLESNENLMDIWVSGEISNLSRPVSGHIYFTLKDAAASLHCVIWREQAKNLVGSLRDGLAVEAHGSVSVYEQGGQYQLYVDALRLAGEGRLFQEFLRLKAKLEAEGLFAQERKRTLPTLPRIIGVVTSPTGAAFQDILRTLRARCPLVGVVLAPAAVQGDAAPAQIVEALDRLNRHVRPDVILLGRGGGSLEDLWAFNDERVVQAVVASAAPVISGVGHETDFTLADFAADLRAPTPTGAAILAVPDLVDLKDDLSSRLTHLSQAVRDIIAVKTRQVEASAHHLERFTPMWRIRQGMQRLDDLRQRIAAGLRNYLRAEAAALKAMRERLSALDPAGVLQRGYALVSDAAGSGIYSITQVQLSQDVNVRLSDGAFNADVKTIHSKEGN